MGWYYTLGATRADTIRELTEEQVRPRGGHFRTIRHTTAGNVLWAVHESHNGEEAKLFIGCYLLGRGRGGSWGYKPMDESMHPYYYTCPLAYLRMVEVECMEWRHGVSAYWARRAKKRASKGKQQWITVK